MFAILIAEETLPKIICDGFDTNRHNLNHFIRHHRNWYFIRGYVSGTGRILDWVIFPEVTLSDAFEYDPERIQTDWDQIVRK